LTAFDKHSPSKESTTKEEKNTKRDILSKADPLPARNEEDKNKKKKNTRNTHNNP